MADGSQLSWRTFSARFRWDHFPWPKVFLIGLALLPAAAGFGVFVHYYTKYARMIDEKLRAGAFANTTLYAAPRRVVLGENLRVEEIASALRRSGYSEASHPSRLGWYRVRPDAIEIIPGPDGYDREGAVISIQAGHVARIVALSDHTNRAQFALEPEPITNVFDRSREKRVIVPYYDIPRVMVNAVLSAEDKHFFQHAGFDPMAILRAIWVDAKDRRNSQGASTLTQQLARTLWLGHERGWRRKIPEILITMHLEHMLGKQQIFEDYANAIYLGHLGSFSIQGFGEASKAYLGKDLSRVTLADAALLAGLIQAPYTRNPFRYPERAKARRDLILKSMRANRFISEREYQEAAAAPLKVTHEEADSSDAPYFVDLVNETLQNRFQEYDFQNHAYRVYTTLDMNLQRDAVEAVRIGIQESDQQWKGRSKEYGSSRMPPVQVALVALDTQTGQVKALVGGRSYSASQFDHAMAKRQPGSSFKPFVYTAALSAALTGDGPELTPASTVEDEPTTFYFGGKTYEPGDYDRDYAGPVTLRYALAHSLNIPAVKVAEMVGYDKVGRVARAAGLNADIAPTPSIALGSYEVTPLEIAGAYTMFANYGNRLKTSFIQAIHDQNSERIYEWKPEPKHAIDPRVAYLVENMMEEVLRSGTGAGVHARGFNLPAAGKTGTSRDGWFVGFTSKLLCVVWVGFDDNHDIKLEGARSALPIWAEFMKRAHQREQYRNVHGFEAPRGIVSAEIDAETGELAAPGCPKVRSEVFIEGTQPVQICHLHGNGHARLVGASPGVAVSAR